VKGESYKAHPAPNSVEIQSFGDPNFLAKGKKCPLPESFAVLCQKVLPHFMGVALLIQASWLTAPDQVHDGRCAMLLGMLVAARYENLRAELARAVGLV
jgi:hypothetical protein